MVPSVFDALPAFSLKLQMVKRLMTQEWSQGDWASGSVLDQNVENSLLRSQDI